MATTQVGGYQTNALSSQDPRRGVTVTTTSTKTFLDVQLGGTAGGIFVIPPNTVTATFSGNQTSATLVTPSSGKKIQVIGIMLTSDDSTFTATVEFETSSTLVAEHYEQHTLGQHMPTNLTGATDEVLSLTISDSVGSNWFVQVNYAEVD